MIILFTKRMKESYIDLQLDPSDSLADIEVIPDQIKQVVLNLLQNAEQAIPESGGEIRIATEHVDSSVKIHISATGRGISQEVMKHIFDPFFTAKAGVKGMGLGLSISQGILKAHGGEIEFESEPGKGTTMTITLPIKKDSAMDNVLSAADGMGRPHRLKKSKD